MRLVIWPAVDEDRLARITQTAKAAAAPAPAEVVNAHSLDEALASIAEAEGFFGKLTPELLARSTRLRWVQSPTASLEHYVFPELVNHPCQLSNMRGIYSDVIADFVLGLVVCLARNIHRYIRQQMAAHWEPIGGESERVTFATGPGVQSSIDRAHLHLADCTMGIVGFGHIGREIGRRARAFGMRILAIDPQAEQIAKLTDEHHDGLPAPWPVSQLDQLLAESDFVVIAAPHTPETERMFCRPRFEQMRRSAFLINIGRGAIVDLADLTSALADGTIAGAALDVFEQEPLPADHPLWKMENAMLTPHIAACTPPLAQRHLEVVLENVRRFFAGETPLNLVDKANWY